MFDTTAWKMFWRIVENCPVAVFATDAAGRYLFVNRPWSKLTGVTRDEAVGWGWQRIVHPGDVANVGSRWRRLVTHGDGFSIQVRLIRPGEPPCDAVMQTMVTSAGDGRQRIVGTLTVPSASAFGNAAGPVTGVPVTGVPVSSPRVQGRHSPIGPSSAGQPDTDDVAVQERAEPDLASREPTSHEPAHHEPADLEHLDDGQAELDRLRRREAAFELAALDPDLLDGHLLDQDLLGLQALASDGVPAGDLDRFGVFDGPGPFDLPDQSDRSDRPDRVDEIARLDGLDGHGDTEETDLVDAAGDREDDGEYPRREAPSAWPRADQSDRGWEWSVPLPRRPVPGEPTPGRATSREATEDRPTVGFPRGTLPPGAEWRAAVALHRSENDDLRPFGRARGSNHTCGCPFTEARRIEEACRDRERWLTTLLAELTTAVLIADRDGRVVAVNQVYCDLFDLADLPVDLVGTDCRLQLRPRPGLVDDPSGFATRLDTLLRRRRTLRREAVMFADGRVFERSHIPLTAADGYRGHVWLYSDVTDRRILEAEIEGLISGL